MKIDICHICVYIFSDGIIMCQLHLAMRSWKLILQLNRKQPNRAKHGTRCAIGFLLSSFYNSMCISNHEVVDNILYFLAAPPWCIHSKSEFRGPNWAEKNLNFPQKGPKWHKNDPKWPKNDPHFFCNFFDGKGGSANFFAFRMNGHLFSQCLSFIL